MLQERLQLMFHDRTITSLHEKYLQEQIDCDMGDLEELTTPAPLISLIDKQVTHLLILSNPRLSCSHTQFRTGQIFFVIIEFVFKTCQCFETSPNYVERVGFKLWTFMKRSCLS